MPPSNNSEMDRSFLTASIPELLKQLTSDEKISLLAGRDWWNTVPVPRLNIPSIKMTDGPGGARGDSFYHMTPACALPSATSLGATFSPSLLETAGHLLALETKARNAVCLLAPTINIQRSPLGGRAFESFSEDPTLSGLLAAGYVRGLQAEGVSATIKHFVANDQEHERMGEDSVIGERALREVYLRPFQLAVRGSKPQAFMTAYNKLNGVHCSENKWLLDTVLRGEWGHTGPVMSDWFGTYSVSESINAGLNLEMPGPTVWRTQRLVQHLLGAHKVDPRQLDKVAQGVLEWVQLLARRNEEIVYAPPSPERTRTESQEEDAKLLRRLVGEGIVLLKNDMGVLPLTPASDSAAPRTVAVIGPNTKAKVLTGGGSAHLRDAWSSTPWEGLVANAPAGIELSYSIGCPAHRFLPVLDDSFTCPDGDAGFEVAHYPLDSAGGQAAEPVLVEKRDDSDLFMADFEYPDLGKQFFTELRAVWTPEEDGEWEFGVVVTGKGWLWVDEELVVDLGKEAKRGESYFGSGTDEKKGTVKVVKGKKYNIRLLHDSRPYTTPSSNTPIVANGFRLGFFPVTPTSTLIASAVSLASKSDTAVLIVGLNADWESEGFDRPTLSLPLATDKLIAAVAAANPNTVVVIQAGSAVSMPWIDSVRGVVYAWYGGNECGNGLADVLYGTRNPSGRLPLSLPRTERDIAAYLNSKSARTKVYYEEGIWVGYKHFNARGIEPLFPFGHGLSYTTFAYHNLRILAPPASPKETGADAWKVEVQVEVQNTGDKEGDHTVQFYVCPPEETAAGLKHPERTLQAFEKVYGLKPGEKRSVAVVLDKYAVSHWDELWQTWRAELGEWTVRVGLDAQTMAPGEATFTIEDDFEWKGL